MSWFFFCSSIRDLGYFDLKDLNAIDKCGAYFISRLKLDTRIYQKNKEPEYFQKWSVFGTCYRGT
ncbi:hypothetical protein GCM10020331_010910 [Ectobacillus funiculus]